MAESSANLTKGHVIAVDLQSAVYRVNKNGASKAPCGVPVLEYVIFDDKEPNLTYCARLVSDR